MKADLGSLAEKITGRGIMELGKDFWAEHAKTVEDFWESISRYFDSLDVAGMKIYQDGMVANGEIGLKIIEETAKVGSKNFMLLSRLIQKGAILVRTEDLKLVKQERNGLLAITQAKSRVQQLISTTKYRSIKDSLLNRRDSFIAKRIEETLHEGEQGIIFIGAYHNVKDMLPADIRVEEIKDIEKIREYQRLLPVAHQNKARFEELQRYLTAEIKLPDQSK
jgi:hypothetical protein